MATGDLKNNLHKLQTELKYIQFAQADFERMIKGDPAAFLPVYHHIFINYSRYLAEEIAARNIELFGKTDIRFIECLYKLLREIFSYKPPLTRDQFFSGGFAERKIIMCCEIVTMARKRHRQLMPKSVKPARPHSATQPNKDEINVKNQHDKHTTSNSDSSERMSQTTASKPSKTSAAAVAVVKSQPSHKVVPQVIRAEPVLVKTHPCQAGVSKNTLDPNNEGLVIEKISPGFVQKHVTDRHGGALPAPPRLSDSSAVFTRMSDYSVEVVNVPNTNNHGESPMPRRYEEPSAGTHIRPIDMIAQTPARSVPSTVSQDTNNVAQLQKQVASLVKQVSSMEQKICDLTAHVAMLESEVRMSAVSPSKPADSSQQQLESILARLTLMEVAMSEVRSKNIPLPTSPVVNCFGHQESLQNNHSNHIHEVRQDNHSNHVQTLRSTVKQDDWSPPPSLTNNNNVESKGYEPSPIVGSAPGSLHDLMSPSFQSDDSKPGLVTSSTPAIPQFKSLSSQEQTSRITNMFKDTDTMLGINTPK